MLGVVRGYGQYGLADDLPSAQRATAGKEATGRGIVRRDRVRRPPTASKCCPRWPNPIPALPANRRCVPSTINCTVPVGVPDPADTVAVKLTACPYAEGFGWKLTVVVVACTVRLPCIGNPGSLQAPSSDARRWCCHPSAGRRRASPCKCQRRSSAHRHSSRCRPPCCPRARV